ncbi:transmembrane protein 183B-like isoform X2 [Acanthaster planci]|nr:transmembrane protein 183B-like isoform X2 [Acanthaster planci]XP_022083743.1 transmembrane protein 183B-like isoform X2 [Acanthaster planci]XP_022083744.1 transmembrane protein 183B-like isoform X2 [Acanthaster planci]
MPVTHRKHRRKRTSARREGSSKESSDSWQRSKLKGRNGRANLIFAHEKDVTLDAFADNASSRALAARVSKARATSINKEVKQVESASAILAAQGEADVVDDWYERNFSEDEESEKDATNDEAWGLGGDGCREKDAEMTVTSKEPDQQEQEDDHVTPAPQGKTTTCVYTGGQIHPSVIWYLVSFFINPEDVATFACLCRDTYALTNTAGFWRMLYFRYYNMKAAQSLPKELHPTSIQRTFGLRALVIRSLQFLYAPFVQRNAAKAAALLSSGDSLTNLVGRVFMYHVSKRKAGSHIYFLKFQERQSLDSGTLNAVEALNRDPDIHVNNHSGQSILRVICKQAHHLEPERIMGKELVRASVNISTGMSYSRLKLEFQEPAAGRGRAFNRSRFDRKRENTCIVLDPVVCARVFHWWDPNFHEEFRTNDSSVITNNINLDIWNGT